MRYEEIIKGIGKYGSAREDICRAFLGLNADRVQEQVILAPWWGPGVFDLPGGKAVPLAELASVKTWAIEIGNFRLTYVKTGIGAPLLMDAVLALGLTRCKRIVFVGSVGGLDARMKIGDVVIPEYSICGDGASRYLKAGRLEDKDAFGEKAFPNAGFSQQLKAIAGRRCRERDIGLHPGRVFSIDTIFAQFVHLDEILAMRCNAIEMETAAAFRAAEMAGIALAALLSVSDNIVNKKSLISGRTNEEIEYRKEVRREVFPKIIFELFDLK